MYEYETNLRIQSDKKQLNRPPPTTQQPNNKNSKNHQHINTLLTECHKNHEDWRKQTGNGYRERRRVNKQPTNSLHPLTTID